MTRSIFSLFAALLLALSTGAVAQDADPANIDADHPPGVIEVSFVSHGEQLNGLHYTANGAGPHPTVVLLHGYPGNEKNLDVAQYLRRAGWNVFFFHYRGAWGSDGQFSFLNAVEDVASALAHMRASGPEYRVDKDHIALVGHSMGGFMALSGAANDDQLQCTVGLAAADYGGVAGIFADNPEATAGLTKYADGLIMLEGHDGTNVVDHVLAAGAAYPLSGIAEGLSGKKVLLIAAENDTAVPVAVHNNMERVFRAQEDIAVSTEVFDADHSFSAFRIALSRTVTDWLNGNCR